MSNYNLNLKVVEKLKRCSFCKEDKSIFDFSKNKASSDGLQYKCRLCDVEYQKNRRIKNKDHVLDYSRNYQKNKRKNFEFRLQMLLNASKQRSKKKSRENTLTLEDIKSIYPKNGLCPIFGTKLVFGDAGFRETSPSIDRIDSTKGYTKDNIQIISWKANRIKTNSSIEELELILAYMKQGI
jgi:CRISPR/Cas system-associated protein Cas10 (large subunit of type III CRISPR-Cas system)